MSAKNMFDYIVYQPVWGDKCISQQQKCPVQYIPFRPIMISVSVSKIWVTIQYPWPEYRHIKNNLKQSFLHQIASGSKDICIYCICFKNKKHKLNWLSVMHYWSHCQSIWSAILIILHLLTPKITSSNSHLHSEMTENPKQTGKQVKRVHNLVSCRDYSSQEREKKTKLETNLQGDHTLSMTQ